MSSTADYFIEGTNTVYGKSLDFLDNFISSLRNVSVAYPDDFSRIFGSNHRADDYITLGVSLSFSTAILALEEIQNSIRAYQNTQKYFDQIVKMLGEKYEKEFAEFRKAASNDAFNKTQQADLEDWDKVFWEKYKLAFWKEYKLQLDANQQFIIRKRLADDELIQLEPAQDAAKPSVKERMLKLLDILADGADFFWNNTLSTYNGGFWIGWFFTWIFTGITIATTLPVILLSFGLPLIPVVLYAIYRLYKWSTRKPLAPDQLPAEEEQQLLQHILKVKLLEVHYKNQKKLLGEITEQEIDSIKQNLKIKRALDRISSRKKDLKKKPKYGHRLNGDFPAKKFIKKMIEIFGRFVREYIFSFFSSWPLTNLLVGVGAISLAASGGPVAILIVLAVTVACGIAGALYAARKETQKAEDNKDLAKANETVLEELKQVKIDNKILRDLANSHFKKIQENKIEDYLDCKPKILDQCIDKAESFERTKFVPGVENDSRFNRLQLYDVADKMAGVFLNITSLFPAWTGLLFWRSLAVGGVLSLLVPHIGLPVFLAVGLTCAAVLVIHGIVKNHLTKCEERDRKLVEQAAGNKIAIEAENEYLIALLAKQEKVLSSSHHDLPSSHRQMNHGMQLNKNLGEESVVPQTQNQPAPSITMHQSKSVSNTNTTIHPDFTQESKTSRANVNSLLLFHPASKSGSPIASIQSGNLDNLLAMPLTARVGGAA